jgi:predicted metalloprotease with PDZ domain
MRWPTRLGGVLGLVALAAPATAPAADPVMSEAPVYTVRFPEPATHHAEVEARLPAPPGGGDLELMMATWTPGSYLIREFARNVEAVAAEGPDGRSLAVRKTAKNRWRVAADGAPVTVRYRLYCRELTVRTNFVEPGLALFNGAATFLVPAGPDGPLPGPYEVRVEPPPGFGRVVTALARAPGAAGGEARFTAPDYDTLVDSPIYAGDGRLHRFDVGGVPHRVLHHGGEGVWDDERSVADTERIVRAQRELWGELPYPRYLFLNLIVEAGGGLEHADSTTLMTSRWKAGTREGYLDWLGLVSHELFHAWNVKRLRPVELAAFDYEQEVYTRSLWVAEGVTSYYDDLLVHRAGLATREEYLKRLSKSIERLQTTPGRKLQPVELASFDAWIKLYRPDEHTANSAISYYTKGAVVAFLLDAEIRRATGDARSLDDALRLAWERFGARSGRGPGEGAGGGFSREELRAVLEEVAGAELDPFLERALETTEELDYSRALTWYGLRFKPSEKEDDQDDPEPPAAWLGAETSVDDGRLVVTRVPRETPAWEAGLSPEDEILALDGYRVPPRGLEERLKALRPGRLSTLLVARRERLLELPVTLGEKPAETWKLEADPEATDEQRAHLAAWLTGPEELDGE